MVKHIQMPPTYPIPNNWTWVELRKLTKIISGYPFDSKLFSDLGTEGRPLIRIRDVVRGYTETYTTEDCPEQYFIHKNDILIGMDGDFNVGRWQDETALLNQRVCYIQSTSDLLLNDYLFYFLPTPLKQINDVTPSVTVKHLSTKTIESIMIPLPPVEEQIRLCELIQSLFGKLDESQGKAQEVVDGFETRKAAILHKAFSGELTEKWRSKNEISIQTWDIQKLKNCGAWCGGGTPSMQHPEYWENGNLLWITAKDMKSDIITETQMLTNMLGVENSSANYIEKPSILFVMRSGILRRTLPIAMVKIPFTVNQDLKVLTPDKLNLEYLFWACKAFERDILKKCMKSGTTVESINSHALLEYELPIPQKREQEEIVSIIKALIAKEVSAIASAEAIIDQIDTMKKAILARAFRGELGTNNPSEESAVELLRKIIGEK